MKTPPTGGVFFARPRSGTIGRADANRLPRRARRSAPPLPMSRLPPGSNVGTQLRALRARQARAERADSAKLAGHATDGARGPRDSGTPMRLPLQLSLASAEGWFAARGWMPFEFQRAVWEHIAAGRSGLVHAATGTGKTYAVWFGLLQSALARRDRASLRGELAPDATRAQAQRGLRMLWITPMRALAADTARSLAAPVAELGLDWRVGVRTGDTDAGEMRTPIGAPA